MPANSPFKSLADVVAAAKAKPGDVTFASPGNGTVAHLTGELFQNAAGIKFQHVPYKGSSQALTDLMGGQVQVFMSSVPTALSQIKGGKLRAIAVTGAKRAAELPKVPTIDESGFKGFDATTWFGLLVPAKTPPEIVKRLNEEVNTVLKDPEVRAKLATEGGEVVGRHAGAVRCAPQGRHRPLGEGREGFRREGRLTVARPQQSLNSPIQEQSP